MKLKIPESYDAGITQSGKSLGFRVNLDAGQVTEIFRRHPDVNHIETPGGFYVRDRKPPTEIKIVVRRGMVDSVYSTDGTVDVDILDCDGDDKRSEAHGRAAAKLEKNKRFKEVTFF